MQKTITGLLGVVALGTVGTAQATTGPKRCVESQFLCGIAGADS